MDWRWLVLLAVILVVGCRVVFRHRFAACPDPVTIIARVRNLEDCLEGLVRCIFAVGRRTGREIQLIVVDDRSRDQTPQIASRLAGIFPQMLFLDSPGGSWRLLPKELNERYGRHPRAFFTNLYPPLNYLKAAACLETCLGLKSQKNNTKEGLELVPIGAKLKVTKCRTHR